MSSMCGRPWKKTWEVRLHGEPEHHVYVPGRTIQEALRNFLKRYKYRPGDVKGVTRLMSW